MKLFDLVGKSAKKEPKPAQEPEREISLEEHGVYSGMRVEVMDAENHLLFIAKLMSLNGDGAKLHPYSKAEVSFEEEMKIKIRVGPSGGKHKAGGRRHLARRRAGLYQVRK